jgi:predicted aspartyl protease
LVRKKVAVAFCSVLAYTYGHCARFALGEEVSAKREVMILTIERQITSMKNLQGKVIIFELVKGIALIPGKIDNICGYFALDTGATQTTLNKAHCGAVNTAAEKAITFDNGTQSSEIASMDKALLTVANTEIEVANPSVMDMTYVEVPLRTENPDLVFLGSIGADMIGTERLVVDYIHKQAIFHADKVPSNAKEIPLSVETLPIVEIEMQDKAYRFVLDTGANQFALDQAVAPMEIICDSDDADAPHCIKSLRFAGREYQNITGVVTDLSSVRDALHVDGIIGYQLLKDYICCFDYKAGRLYLSQE